MTAAAPSNVAAVHAALVRRFRSQYLSVRYVDCFADRARFRGSPVVRCRVSFGDPHLVQYCSAIVGGRLLTDHEVRAIRCGQHPDLILTGADPRSFAR